MIRSRGFVVIVLTAALVIMQPLIVLAAAAPREQDAPRSHESQSSTAPTDKAPPSPAEVRQQRLDDLFARLAASTDPTETNGLVLAIDRLQLESGSATGDLLMARAVAALETHNFDTSLALLDKIVALQPGWAEAWNKRATVRHLTGDDDASMIDIAHVLKLEPRHFGALSGLGMILESRGFRDDALRAYRRALEIAPQLKSLRDAVARLTTEVDGQPL